MSHQQSTEFSHCPACAGSTEDAEGNYQGCTTCAGTGDRRVTEENIRLATSAKEWADDRIGDFFSDWIRVNGSWRGYGVESWSISGGELRLTIDVSRRGCYDTETLKFPSKWFFATGEERLAFLRADLEERALHDAQAREQKRVSEIESLKARLAQLETAKS